MSSNPNISITVRFFAGLSEALRTRQIELEISAGSRLEDLKKLLQERGEAWQPLADSSILTALNLTMTTTNPLLQNGDEVAFFPPVTGG